MVYAYDAVSAQRVNLAGPVATAHRLGSSISLLGRLTRRRGGVCGDGCWPAPGGGCDCGGTIRGLGAPLVSPMAVTTLGVLAALAAGAWIYGKVAHR